MQIVARTAMVLQSVLTTEADEVAKQCGVIQRKRKFRGSSLAQMFVFGWLHNPQATVEQLAQQAVVSGATVSPQAVQQRFTRRLGTFFQTLLQRAIGELVVSEAKVIPLLQKFPGGVWINDSTVINLPTQFAEQWPSCGGDAGQSEASLKVQFCFEYCSGACRAMLPEPGRCSDRSSAVQQRALPAGSLRLADLGYFRLSVLAQLAQCGASFITRIQPHTALFSEQGERLTDLRGWLNRQRKTVIDVPVILGVQQRLRCRLVAVRAADEVIRKRRARLKKEARRRGRPISSRQWAWAEWTILATNLPAETATWQELCVLYRARWQIELLFKLWKSQGQIAVSRSNLSERKLAEVFAKLLGMIVQHWLLLTTVWQLPNVSLMKAASILRGYIPAIAMALPDSRSLRRLLKQLRQLLSHHCRMNPKRKQPNTYQLLLDPKRLKWGLT